MKRHLSPLYIPPVTAAEYLHQTASDGVASNKQTFKFLYHIPALRFCKNSCFYLFIYLFLRVLQCFIHRRIIKERNRHRFNSKRS